MSNTSNSALVDGVVPSERFVRGYARNYASGALSADYDPQSNGSFFNVPGATGALQSLTVTVLRAGNIPAGPNRIIAFAGGGEKFFMVQGQTATWSVAQDDGSRFEELEKIDVACEGDSACSIMWTEEAL